MSRKGRASLAKRLTKYAPESWTTEDAPLSEWWRDSPIGLPVAPVESESESAPGAPPARPAPAPWRAASEPACRHDREDPSCQHDWRDDAVAVAALQVLVAAPRGEVMSAYAVRTALRFRGGVHAGTAEVRRALHLLGRHRLVHRHTDGLDASGRAELYWQASKSAKAALASVAA